MVHLPDTLGEDLLKILQSHLDAPPVGVEAINPDKEVEYTLVQHVWPKDYDYPLIDWDEDDDVEYVDERDGEYDPNAPGWMEGRHAKYKIEAKLEPVEVFCSTCEVCDKQFFNKEQFEDHAKEHNPSLIQFTCGITQCGVGFILESQYQIHVKMHEKELKDAEIDKKSRELMVQVDTEDGQKWKCTECDYMNKIRYTVHSHCETHLITKHDCHLCDAVCNTRNAMRTHMYRKHPEAVQRQQAASGSNYRKTNDDNDSDFNESDDDFEPLEFDERAKNYEPAKQKRRPYEKTCTVCNHNFHSKNLFDDHAKVHNPSLIKYTCEECLEGFIVEREYNQHLQKHKIEKTRAMGAEGIEREVASLVTTTYDEEARKMFYVCTYCGYKSVRKNSVMEHAESHTNIVHACPVCNKASPSKNALRAHMLRQHGTSRMSGFTPRPARGRGSRGKRQPAIQHTIRYNPPGTPGTPNSNISYNSQSYSPQPQQNQYPCPHCHKSSPTSNALRVHITRYHKEPSTIKQEYQSGNQQYQQPTATKSNPTTQQVQVQYQKPAIQQQSTSKQLLPAPKPSKPAQPAAPQFTQLRPPAAHSGHVQTNAAQQLQAQQALALQAQQNAFPDFFWNKY